MSRSPWVLASRPATLWAGVSPVIVGTALAIDDDAFRADVLIAALIVAISVQIGVNFANDVADAARGADGRDRIGPTRAVAAGLISPRSMWVGVALAFGAAAAAGVYLAALTGPEVLLIGLVSFAAALGYTNGPKPYGYHGLGEVFVFVFFGLVATVGTRYVYDGAATAGAWVGGTTMGFLASGILIANNVRDRETDERSGKRTLAVLLGPAKARTMFVATLIAAYLTVVAGVAGDALQPGALLALGALPVAVGPIRAVRQRADGPGLVGALKATARLQLLTAALLAAGILI